MNCSGIFGIQEQMCVCYKKALKNRYKYYVKSVKNRYKYYVKDVIIGIN